MFRATNGKWRAVVVEISRMNKTGRPVLVGTTSVEQSDSLSEQLQQAGIPHEVSPFLNYGFNVRNEELRLKCAYLSLLCIKMYNFVLCFEEKKVKHYDATKFICVRY